MTQTDDERNQVDFQSYPLASAATAVFWVWAGVLSYKGDLEGAFWAFAAGSLMNPQWRAYCFERTGIAIPKLARAWLVVLLICYASPTANNYIRIPVKKALSQVFSGFSSQPEQLAPQGQTSTEELGSKQLMLRPGIDDLGLTVDRFVQAVRASNIGGATWAAAIEEGGWLDPGGSHNLVIRKDGADTEIVLNLVPVGQIAVLVETVSVNGESSQEFQEKVGVMSLFFTR